MSERLKSVFSGVATAQLFQIVYLFINLSATPFIVKHLNAETYGLSVILFQITTYLSQMDFGFSAGVARFLAGTREPSESNIIRVNKIVTTSFIIYLVLGIFIGIGGSLFANAVPGIFSVANNRGELISIVRGMSIIVGCQFLLKTISGIFFAHQKQALANTLTFVLSVSNILLVVLFVSMGYGLWSFLYAQAISFVISGILNLYFFKRHYRHVSLSLSLFDKQLLKDVFSYGFSLFLIGLAVQVVFQTDRLFVGSLISLAAVSVYSLTTKIPELTASVIWKISENAFPAMVELSQDNSTNKFEEAHSKIMRLTLSISLVALWSVLILCPAFLTVWVGKEYFAGYSFLILVSYLYLFQHTIINVTSVCLNGAGLVKGISRFSLLEAVMNIGLSYYMGKSYGLNGIVIATIISAMLTSGWYVPYVAVRERKFNFLRYLKDIAIPVIASSLLGLPVYLLSQKFAYKIDNWLSLIVSSIVIVPVISIPIIWTNRKMIAYLKARLSKS